MPIADLRRGASRASPDGLRLARSTRLHLSKDVHDVLPLEIVLDAQEDEARPGVEVLGFCQALSFRLILGGETRRICTAFPPDPVRKS
eukprot:scaffold7362_cov266-Pinguiococcus_pyrenoidosus.AAC.16